SPLHTLQGGADGNGRVWLDNVKCSGEEGGIDLCAHDPWGYTPPTFAIVGVSIFTVFLS
ncbi:hypothetical protein T484DRAFT_1644679, partial [Baffinella frigidus]